MYEVTGLIFSILKEETESKRLGNFSRNLSAIFKILLLLKISIDNFIYICNLFLLLLPHDYPKELLSL